MFAVMSGQAAAKEGSLHPSWSPDGLWVAFQSDRDGDHEIYVVRTDGSGLRGLTHNDTEDAMPTWSPDGAIQYMTMAGGEHVTLEVPLAGGVPRRVETPHEPEPKKSRDGRLLAWEARLKEPHTLTAAPRRSSCGRPRAARRGAFPAPAIRSSPTSPPTEVCSSTSRAARCRADRVQPLRGRDERRVTAPAHAGHGPSLVPRRQADPVQGLATGPQAARREHDHPGRPRPAAPGRGRAHSDLVLRTAAASSTCRKPAARPGRSSRCPRPARTAAACRARRAELTFKIGRHRDDVAGPPMSSWQNGLAC